MRTKKKKKRPQPKDPRRERSRKEGGAVGKATPAD